ncbi:hypothetical protein D3C81_1678610 [compost metagenome]
MSGVFNQGEIMAFCHLTQFIHLQRCAGIVHRDNGFGFRRNGGFNITGADHQRIAVNVNHHRRRTEQFNHVEGRNPGLGRGDNFVTRANVQRHQGDMHTCSSGTDGDSVFTAEGGTELTFQLLILRSGGDPA